MIAIANSIPWLEQKEIQIHLWLSQMHYMKHHRTALEGMLEGTGQWLLRKKEFRQWRSSSVSSILWLHGIRKRAVFTS